MSIAPKNQDNFEQIPTSMNYARVVLDVVMLVLLVVTVSGLNANQNDPLMSLHIHEVPVYLKSDLDIGKLWAAAGGMTGTDTVKLGAFKSSTVTACAGIVSHPMCTCVAGATAYLQAKSCLLQHPIPSQYSDWNVVGVAPALFLWFTASLATSVGTLPFISTYVSVDWGEMPGKATVLKWNRGVVITYVLLLGCTLAVPVLVSAILFQGDVHRWGGLFNMLMWSGISFLCLALYNYPTFLGYLSWTKLGVHDLNLRLMHSITHNLTVNNWILYVHLLIAAPAIAVVIHLTQNWAEYHTIVNTTLVLSTIFAVDAFAAEMANYWSCTSTVTAANTANLSEATKTTVDAAEVFDTTSAEISSFNLRLGLIRFFAWSVNAVMFLLLFTMAYPVDVAGGDDKNAIFLVVVVIMGAAFLVPDLVREFTSIVGFNSIQYRAFGDVLVRTATLFFVLRASTHALV